MGQSVMLTGLSSTKFNNAMASIHAIEDMFRQLIATGQMDDWAPSNFKRHMTIDISNRYFTPAHDASHQDEQVTSLNLFRIVSIASVSREIFKMASRQR